MNASNSRYTMTPFVVVTFIYFVVGFLTTVNGQFQGPMKIAFLSGADELRNTLATLISFFFFLGYLLNSGTASRWITVSGYKTTMMRALGVMVGSLALYSLSSWIADSRPDMTFQVGRDVIPVGYVVFLAGSFLMGSASAMLQVVINPYVSAYELPGTSPVQRMNIVCGINSIGTTVAPFFVTGVIFAGVALEAVRPDQLMLPFVMIAVVVVLIVAVLSGLSLPEMNHTRGSSDSRLPRSVWSFRHLALGVTAIFFYVGAEVAVGVNVNLHAMQLIETGHKMSFFGHDRIVLAGLDLGIPALLATLYWGGMMVGRLVSGFFGNVSPRRLLVVTTLIASGLVVLAMSLDNLWVLVSVGLLHSVMWGCIFTLAVAGLGRYTSRASGVFMMGVFGGAVFPLIQSVMADVMGDWQWTWSIVLICELFMLYYGIWGSRVTDGEALRNINLSPSDPG